ncbi:MAG: hypothetical protein ACH34X_04865 [Thiolinea sp.]
MATKSVDKWQYGDFQTPDVLANTVVEVLKRNHKLSPSVVVEPSCGKGAFIRAAIDGFTGAKVLGFDINRDYIREANLSLENCHDKNAVFLDDSDFFSVDWEEKISAQSGFILVIGNPPWVTSSELGILNSENLPDKSNFQNRRGIEAITGSGNFDISEWMLLRHVDWLSKREGAIAVLCKYSVARKVMRQIMSNPTPLYFGHIYPIDAKEHFNASVEACLFVLVTGSGNSDCDIYDGLDSTTPSRVIGARDGIIVNDVLAYEQSKHLSGQDPRYIWRSGIKHDCSKVMELERINAEFKNGLGEHIDLEEDYIYPLFKSSDIGNGRTEYYRKVVLITQKYVGEDTSTIQVTAPKTWKYLCDHKDFLEKRQSSIYKNKPLYSVFGIGAYTFKEWKIAISALYKKLKFNLIGPIGGKVVAFDDTVNFLSFDTEEEAKFVFSLLTSTSALKFLDSIIFWDEKRPITIDVLRRLSLKAVAEESGLKDEYMYWADSNKFSSTGQLELGIAESKSHYKVTARTLVTTEHGVMLQTKPAQKRKLPAKT